MYEVGGNNCSKNITRDTCPLVSPFPLFLEGHVCYLPVKVDPIRIGLINLPEVDWSESDLDCDQITDHQSASLTHYCDNTPLCCSFPKTQEQKGTAKRVHLLIPGYVVGLPKHSHFQFYFSKWLLSRNPFWALFVIAGPVDHTKAKFIWLWWKLIG